jgi:hypothetical protein
MTRAVPGPLGRSTTPATHAPSVGSEANMIDEAQHKALLYLHRSHVAHQAMIVTYQNERSSTQKWTQSTKQKQIIQLLRCQVVRSGERDSSRGSFLTLKKLSESVGHHSKERIEKNAIHNAGLMRRGPRKIGLRPQPVCRVCFSKLHQRTVQSLRRRSAGRAGATP